MHSVGSVESPVDAIVSEDTEDFLGVVVEGQLFGIPINRVFDILDQRPITRVPLSSKSVLGLINLRGRIVTAIDVRERLGVEPREESDGMMHVVVERDGESYSLVVDSVTEAKTLRSSDLEATPAILDERWRAISKGVHRIEHGDEPRLMVMADVDKLLDLSEIKAN